MTLLTSTDFTYLGAFRLPTDGTNSFFGFNPGPIAIDPGDSGKMFVACHDQESTSISHVRIAKITIPTLSTSSNISNLNRATISTNGVDILTGLSYDPALGDGDGNTNSLTGMHVFGSGSSRKLVFAMDISYDSAGTLVKTHGWCPADLSASHGLYTLGSYYPRYANMGMCDIPSNWQSSFGGYAAMTTAAGRSIVSNSSDGPSVASFDWTKLGTTNPCPATLYQRYDTGQLDSTSGTTQFNTLWTQLNFFNGAVPFFYDYNGKLGLGFAGQRVEGWWWYGYGDYYNWRNDPLTFPADSNHPPLKTGQTAYAAYGQTSGWPTTDTGNRYVDSGANQNIKGQHGTELFPTAYIYDPNNVLTGTYPEHSATPSSHFRLSQTLVATGSGLETLSCDGGDYDATNRKLYLMYNLDMDGLDPCDVVCVWQLP